MKKRLSIVLVAVVVLALILAGCGNKSAIVGNWQGTFGDISFTKDGIVTMGLLGIGVQGSYKFVDSDTIQINMQGISTDYNVKISGDTLSLESGGVSMQYSRVK